MTKEEQKDAKSIKRMQQKKMHKSSLSGLRHCSSIFGNIICHCAQSLVLPFLEPFLFLQLVVCSPLPSTRERPGASIGTSLRCLPSSQVRWCPKVGGFDEHKRIRPVTVACFCHELSGGLLHGWASSFQDLDAISVLNASRDWNLRLFWGCPENSSGQRSTADEAAGSSWRYFATRYPRGSADEPMNRTLF